MITDFPGLHLISIFYNLCVSPFSIFTLIAVVYFVCSLHTKLYRNHELVMPAATAKWFCTQTSTLQPSHSFAVLLRYACL